MNSRIPSKNPMWRAIAVAGLATGLVTVLPFLAGSASAHHSTISAEVDCKGVVAWSSVSWYPQAADDHRGENSDIHVFLQIEDQAKALISEGSYTPTNNYRFSGTFTWPLDDTNHLADYVYVSSVPIAKWGNGNTSTEGESVKVYAPKECPGEPGASVEVSCVVTAPGTGSGTAVVTLTNGTDPWGQTIEFGVYDPDQTVNHTHRYVLPGVDQTVTFTGLEPDGDHTIKVETKTAYTGFPKTLTVNVDCDSPVPAVKLSASCRGAEGAVLVTMTNTGGEAVTFAVTNPRDLVVHKVLVAAGGMETLTFTGFTNGSYTVPVMAGKVDLTTSFRVDCGVPEPSVQVTPSCVDAAGSVLVTLTNTGTLAVVFDVTNPKDLVVYHVLVAAGGKQTLTFSGFANGTYTLPIMVGNTDLSVRFTVNCGQGSVSFSQACVNTDGTLDIHLIAAGGTVPTEFVVEGTTYTVQPNSELVVHLAGLADGVRTIAVTSGTTDLSFQTTIACDAGQESGSELPGTGGGIPTWPATLAIALGSLLLLVRRIGRTVS
jgi:hypothetical protein